MPEQEPARVAPGPERTGGSPVSGARRRRRRWRCGASLHARGRRYRVQARIEGLPRRRVDLVFTRWRLVVLVDGCFWHGCPVHGTMPKANREWWTWKLANNARRDADTDARLTEPGLDRAAAVGARARGRGGGRRRAGAGAARGARRRGARPGIPTMTGSGTGNEESTSDRDPEQQRAWCGPVPPEPSSPTSCTRCATASRSARTCSTSTAGRSR
nr:hypothetical protein [Angustibacter aerolatus]